MARGVIIPHLQRRQSGRWFQLRRGRQPARLSGALRPRPPDQRNPRRFPWNPSGTWASTRKNVIGSCLRQHRGAGCTTWPSVWLKACTPDRAHMTAFHLGSRGSAPARGCRGPAAAPCKSQPGEQHAGCGARSSSNHASGTRTSTVVPSPSAERMRYSPPISRARSRMFSRLSEPRVL